MPTESTTLSPPPAATLVNPPGAAPGAAANPPSAHEAMSTAFAAIVEMKERADELLMEITEKDETKYTYEPYSRIALWPELPMEELPKRVHGLPAPEMMPPGKIGAMTQRIMEYVYSQRHLAQRLKQAQDYYGAFGGRWVDVNLYLMRHWQEDSVFCSQLLHGLHPLVIKRVADILEVPESMADLTADGRSLVELIRERRLFICDYNLLDGVQPYAGMYLYAPIMLLYRVLSDNPHEPSKLAILGIQLTRNPGPNEVYTRTDGRPNKYLFAKLHVACADVQYHQFINHLGLAHLAMEPFAIAHHNAFPAGHTIGALLAPHFNQTLGINYLARRTLISDVKPFTDRIFSAGVRQALAALIKAWKSYDFTRQTLPAMLEARGFHQDGSDGVLGYYYRDDGLLLWDAISDYARDVVATTYPSDGAVAADPVLQTWARESTEPDKGAIPGFPKQFATRDLLSRSLATIIFHASVQHSAVNYPQLHYQSYVPNRPPSLFRPMPEGPGDLDRDYILQSLPKDGIVHFQLLFSYVLIIPSVTPLTQLDAMKDVCPAAHAGFRQRLAAISHVIQERNARLVAAGHTPYPYLLPENVASSVEI